MLFNSAEFLFGFVPVAVLGFLSVRQVFPRIGNPMADCRVSRILRVVATTERSDHRPLDPCQLCLGTGTSAADFRMRTSRQCSKALLLLGIVFNVVFLGVFKYTDFIASTDQ